MSLFLAHLPIIAQASGGSQGPGGLPGLMVTMMPMILIFAVMYFLMIRPQQKKAKEHEALLSHLKTGDRILTSGGIYGVITGVKEKSLQLKIAEGVVIEVSRGAVATVVGKD